MSRPLADSLAGALLGQALGDALGFVVEAAPPAVAAAYVAECLMAGRAGVRTHADHPFGQYSDDTQLAREWLLALRDAGGWSPPAFARRIAALFAEDRAVGAGRGTRDAAARLLAGIPWEGAGTPAPYAGNGSAMRAVPVGLVFRADPARMVEVAIEQSVVTHRDLRCAAGAAAIAAAAGVAARGGALRPTAFLDEVSGRIEEIDASVAAAVGEVRGWVGLTPAAAARRLRASGLDAGWAGEWRGVSAFVLPSVAWSLYAFLRSPDDYWTTVCTAIGVGGDTDTMAAMAGGICGARHGVDALPIALLPALNDRGAWTAPALRELAADCAVVAETSSNADTRLRPS